MGVVIFFKYPYSVEPVLSGHSTIPHGQLLNTGSTICTTFTKISPMLGSHKFIKCYCTWSHILSYKWSVCYNDGLLRYPIQYSDERGAIRLYKLIIMLCIHSRSLLIICPRYKFLKSTAKVQSKYQNSPTKAGQRRGLFGLEGSGLWLHTMLFSTKNNLQLPSWILSHSLVVHSSSSYSTKTFNREVKQNI